MSRFIILFFAVLAALPCAAWQNKEREALEREITAFRSSPELMHYTEHNGQGIYVYNFKYTCKGGEVTDPSFRPGVLKRLEKAFDGNASTAQSRYVHRKDDGKSPMKLLTFTWPNTYMRSVSFSFHFNDTTDFRFLTYAAPDTVRACYALVWSESRFNDHAGKPYRCFDGYVMTLTGNHWDYDTSFYKYVYDEDDRLRRLERSASEAQSEQLDYAILSAKMDELDKIFMEGKRANDLGRMNAAVYTAAKLLRGYNAELTQVQCAQIGSVLQQWQKNTTDALLSQQLTKTVEALTDKNRYAGSDSVRHSVCETSHDFFALNLQKTVDERVIYKRYAYLSGDLGAPYPWQLTGIAPRDSRYVTVIPAPLYSVESVRKVQDHAFSFTKRLQRGQFVKVMDDKAKEIWWVINDSLPVSLNMNDGTVEGSDLNKRFLSYQRRIRAMARDVQKYATFISGYLTIVDEAGYNSVVDSVRKIQYEAITDNKDNIIPAFYLPNLCTEMSPQLLDSVMRRGLAYSDHLAMQPAWAFYEGLKQRLPGQKYHDVELQDTIGNTHRLSEYVGKGNYVLLHFWSTWAGSARKELKTIKDIVREYKDKPLTVIGISLNQNGKDWKNYVSARGLKWTHLSNIKEFDSPAAKAYGVVSMPMTVLIAPDGTIVSQGIQHERLPETLRQLIP